MPFDNVSEFALIKLLKAEHPGFLGQGPSAKLLFLEELKKRNKEETKIHEYSSTSETNDDCDGFSLISMTRIEKYRWLPTTQTSKVHVVH